MQSILSKITLACGAIALMANCVTAQVQPDNTLGRGRSRIDRDVSIEGKRGDRIEGGVRRDGNLFHSFREFNVRRGQRVFFDSPDGIANIFARVTGHQRSRIEGTLGVDGRANLFLLNPNGILLGKGAQLRIQGSFIASTANAVQFGHNGSFSASQPELPSDLLTVQPSAFLFSQMHPAPIDIAKAHTQFEGRNLLLVGGNTRLTHATLETRGGNVAIGGLAEPGAIALTSDQGELGLDIPRQLERANVSLTDATLHAFDEGRNGSGNTTITAQAIQLHQASTLATDTYTGAAGQIALEASGAIALTDQSSIANRTYTDEAQAGRIALQAEEGITLDRSTVSSNTLGRTTGSQIQVSSAGSLLINGTFEQQAGIFSQAEGSGSAGNVTVQVADQLTLRGPQSGITSSGPAQTSSGGTLDVTAKAITLDGDSANISTETVGGQGGNLRLHVRDVLLLRNGSRIATLAGSAGEGGNAGNIQIQAGFIAAVPAENSYIAAGSSKQGAGRVEITTQRLLGIDPLNRAQIEAQLDRPIESIDNPYFPSDLPSSITALAQASPALDGQITINLIDDDPTQVLGELPAELVDISRLIAQPCRSTAANQPTTSQFIVTGRGGLPASPADSTSSDTVITHWANLNEEPSVSSSPNPSAAASSSAAAASPFEADTTMEAQGWVMGADGDVTLVADDSTATPAPPQFEAPHCQAQRDEEGEPHG